MSRRRKAQQNIPAAVMDEFSNPLFRLGYGSQSPLEATEYRTTRLTGNYALPVAYKHRTLPTILRAWMDCVGVGV